MAIKPWRGQEGTLNMFVEDFYCFSCKFSAVRKLTLTPRKIDFEFVEAKFTEENLCSNIYLYDAW